MVVNERGVRYSKQMANGGHREATIRENCTLFVTLGRDESGRKMKLAEHSESGIRRSEVPDRCPSYNDMHARPPAYDDPVP